MSTQLFQSNYQRLGFIPFTSASIELLNSHQFDGYIKIVYAPQGVRVNIDFNDYHTEAPTLFFINSNQYVKFFDLGVGEGYFMYYNRDFYCVQIHDAEVACDGLLFNNIYQMPKTVLNTKEDSIIQTILVQMEEEFELDASTREEMLRIYLKQIIIRATRIWKTQHLGVLESQPYQEIEFFREFSRLVEIHYRSKHLVADYAELLGIAPKTLTHKFKKFELPAPNEVLKDRILLEAKRLLIHTGLSAKQIAYDLGYDDPAYFNRLFSKKIGDAPNIFRKKYLERKNVQLE
ncbi:helix-turn-helix domain-containing protein [Flavobacterium salilacus subsp. salilacus]|uniref:AraC family transcriptional regulator n=1 Tax=Flavobacterium TaxID=237 RepID=UPI0010751E02|nr:MULTISPECIES: helix-turn-helix domain-containing protein [Flavobacterium]KAF2519180.1 helix-turn-helix domain-containing protein [Flavobacterium salilacus subsp. salilacus]MBE1613360.1 helix-turn-helix domain-containing protein [Flavobacterium sp. SaA2.13]